MDKILAGEELGYTFRKFEESDEAALVELLKIAFPNFLKRDFWVWKYKLNPSFDPSTIVVAEKDGVLVGCNHWLIRDLKLSGSLTVKAVLGAEILVHPAHRGQGIGAQLLRFLRVSGVFKEKGVVLSYMFSIPGLSKRLYAPVAGYIAAPSSTTTYKKFFNCRQLKQKIQEINDLIKTRKDLQTKLEHLKMRVTFRQRGVPAFTIYISPEEVYLEEGEVENPDVVVEGSLPVSSSILGSDRGILGWAQAWMTGKFKIKKGLSKTYRMWKAFKVFLLAMTEH